jgi:spore germination protein GerM
MNILITAATDQEISPVKILIERFKDVLEEKGLNFTFWL